jgi:hypothetical protein
MRLRETLINRIMKITLPPIVNTAVRPPDSGFSGSGLLTHFQDLMKEMQVARNNLNGGKNLGTQELLNFQVKSQQYGLEVELCAKVSEGLAGTIRRFHSNQ